MGDARGNQILPAAFPRDDGSHLTEATQNLGPGQLLGVIPGAKQSQVLHAPCVADASVSLRLQLDRGSDPISGSLVFSDGRRLAFSGWIELTAALEEVRHTESLDVVAHGQQTSSSSGESEPRGDVHALADDRGDLPRRNLPDEATGSGNERELLSGDSGQHELRHHQ